MRTLRLLVGASPARISYLEELAAPLSELGIECRMVDDTRYDGYPGSDIWSWLAAGRRFRSLVSEFRPDVILSDRVRGFASRASSSGVPSLIYMRGDYWSELEWAAETTHRSFLKRRILDMRARRADEAFSRAAMILPICRYAERIIQKRHPGIPTRILQNFVTGRAAEPMTLDHPCVGLLQMATVWKKTQEMLLLKSVIKALPRVTFYWAGDGQYARSVLDELEGMPNFRWLGALDRGAAGAYLAGLDIYALVSGMDMSPASLLEAQAAGRPVLATDAGGIPESVHDVGCLIPEGSAKMWIEKIGRLLEDRNLVKEAGRKGVEFANSFSPGTRAEELLGMLREAARI